MVEEQTVSQFLIWWAGAGKPRRVEGVGDLLEKARGRVAALKAKRKQE